MRDLREKKDDRAQETKREIVGKVLQYGMLVILLGIAFILPAYGVNRYARENGGKSGGKQQTEKQYANGAEQQAEEQPMTGAEQQMENQPMTGAERQMENQPMTGAGEGAAEAPSGEENNAAAAKGTIVIDAGHGGDDPGMIGASGINEKVLNLVYAKKLEALLTEAGYQVVQTRDSEEGLYDADQIHKKAQDMQRRCAIIQEAQPLVTVSIHQNSYPQDSSVCGPQVFYYEQSQEGKDLAACIQNSLNQELEVARPREQKGNSSYYILKRSASTTVIVECGFLTNPQEEAKLQEEAYQDQVAQAICDGVLAYLQKSE